jgi:glycine dehydrogenase
MSTNTDNTFAATFKQRHIGLTQQDTSTMLAAIGMDNLETLIQEAVPSSIYDNSEINLPASCSERDALEQIKCIASANKVLKSCIGLGYYNTITPPVILRNILENPSWYTAYTPYQAEISQGRLQMLLAFQQLTVDLTGLEVANASLLDEATAAVEAMLMSWRLTKLKTNLFVVDKYAHPQTIAVLQTRAQPLGIELLVTDLTQDLSEKDYFGLLIQYPDTLGTALEHTDLINAAHAKGALVSMACDLLSLTLLQDPGSLGADIAFGNSQRFGVPLGYGGPHAAFFATLDKYKRAMPGRIIGISQDASGKQALRMALQTREQHIRREKANSNICTAQALLAITAAGYAIYHGPKGLQNIASRVHHLTSVLVAALEQLGFKILSESFFDTITIEQVDAASLLDKALRAGINIHGVSSSQVSIALDETTKLEDIAALVYVFRAEHNLDLNKLVDDVADKLAIAPSLVRSTAYLTSDIFNTYHSETAMMRYLKFLADCDIGLDRAMIPLGSCTMKLNAACEMIPITWPEFGQIHPFVPLDQAQGYAKIFNDLENMLCQITGYAAVSLQPNAGSQGELAGLLVIRAYHQSRGEGERNICLIPTSAHGTNPSSAVVAGFKVVTVKCDDQGNVCLDDLQAKADEHSNDLAAIMVTYPSTHGVFEESITQICDIVHSHGGQVYVDGANLNSLLGIAYPGKFGADVSHINLHKTFAIPHGGGGPGMGPIGVVAHLAPFLPAHPLVKINNHNSLANGDKNITAISAAPWGSASILPISWMYIHAVGNDGLSSSSRSAILSANYISRQLENYYPVLYKGNKGHVAHECIIDIRPLKAASGISEEDIAKRLIDYGFHAPTMSFPVAGTLMIEPTESESKFEIDRFCKAMISIRSEIAKVEAGEWDKIDNPLKNAPHTALELISDKWEHAYTRSEAAYPVESLEHNKYFAPVGRVDNIGGDRNFTADAAKLELVKF